MGHPCPAWGLSPSRPPKQRSTCKTLSCRKGRLKLPEVPFSSSNKHWSYLKPLGAILSEGTLSFEGRGSFFLRATYTRVMIKMQWKAKDKLTMHFFFCARFLNLSKTPESSLFTRTPLIKQDRTRHYISRHASNRSFRRHTFPRIPCLLPGLLIQKGERE